MDIQSHIAPILLLGQWYNTKLFINYQDFYNNYGYQGPYLDISLEYYCVRVGIVTSNVGRFFHLQS